LDGEAGSEFGALAFNYRRQVFGNVGSSVVVSPRFSILTDLGSASEVPFALQVNVPLTAVLSRSIVTHWNLGATIGIGPTIVNAGASAVWLALPWMNFLVEGLLLGRDGAKPTWVVSPGVRWAVNLGSVQVVPGVALPLELGSNGGSGILLYFSIEHPFGPTEE